MDHFSPATGVLALPKPPLPKGGSITKGHFSRFRRGQQISWTLGFEVFEEKGQALALTECEFTEGCAVSGLEGNRAHQSQQNTVGSKDDALFSGGRFVRITAVIECGGAFQAEPHLTTDDRDHTNDLMPFRNISWCV